MISIRNFVILERESNKFYCSGGLFGHLVDACRFSALGASQFVLFADEEVLDTGRDVCEGLVE